MYREDCAEWAPLVSLQRERERKEKKKGREKKWGKLHT